MAKIKSYSVHTIIVFLALAFPMLISFTKEDNKPNLVGILMNYEKPKFTKEGWFSGNLQQDIDDYNNDHWAFKEVTVRLNNQLYYNFFNQIRVNGFVAGKENYVFSESYIFSAFGDDVMKEEKIQAQLSKAKVVQDSLKKRGIDLLLVYAPGKGALCKEFVEDKYAHPIKTTNYKLFAEHSKKLGLNYLDLYEYFLQLKPKSPYPLFPRFGHHWSYYGECLAVDTIIKHIEKLHHCDMPAFGWDGIEVVDTARQRDADILKSMNLANNPLQNMKLAYPKIYFENDSLKNTTRVLTISDSYWYGPVYMGIGRNSFAGGEFWYYNNKVVPSRSSNEKTETWQLDLKTEVESYNVIMLLYADGNLSNFGNSFIEDVYEMYTSPATFNARKERQKQIQVYAKQIREAPLLLKKSTQKSKDLQISLDSAIRADAMKMAGLTK